MAEKRRKNTRRVRNNDGRRSKSNKVVSIRSRFNINLGLIIFGVLFVYIIVVIVSYFKTEHITPYEVKKGSLAVNNTYNAIAVRDEEIVQSEYSGYINYYSREAERVSKNSMIYTVDSTGKLSEMMTGNSNGTGSSLSDEDMAELKTQISEFSTNFNPIEFNKTYDFKYDIEGTVLKLANYNVLSNINSISSAGKTDGVSFGYAPDAGVLVYSIDGYEELTPETVTQSCFDMDIYEKKQFHSNDLIAEGNPAYKLLTNDDWSLVMEIDEEKCRELENESYIEVRFLKNNYKSWGKITILRQDGTIFLQLDFNNSLLTFATDRYLEIELLTDTEEGLKIPNSAIVERPFYLIPIQYLAYGENGTSTGFMRETHLEDGSLSTKFVEATIYNSTDTDYYVDESIFKIDDYVVAPDADSDLEKYSISKQATLFGVYNINKGYADFKQVTVLSQNDEYSIVKSNTEYGLSVYDYIVLDGESVKENDFIYD